MKKIRQNGPSLWGEIIPPPTTKQKQHQEQHTPLDYRDCVIYGHTWQLAGMDMRRQCTVCQVYTYCPTCTPHYPNYARLIYCKEHSPQEVQP